MSEMDVIIGVCQTAAEAKAVEGHILLHMNRQVSVEEGYDSSGKKVWYVRGPDCNRDIVTLFQAGYKAGANSNV